MATEKLDHIASTYPSSSIASTSMKRLSSLPLHGVDFLSLCYCFEAKKAKDLSQISVNSQQMISDTYDTLYYP